MNSKRISAPLIIAVEIVALIGLVATQSNVKGQWASAPQSAGATSPIHEQLPLCLGPFGCDTFVLDAGVACSFPVEIALEGDLAQTTFFDSDGNPVRAIQTGQLNATVTNLDNSESTFLHISGPAYLTFNADGSVNVRLIGPALLPMPGDTLLYNDGTIELGVAPDGSVTLLRRVGHSIDVCAILG
jgi:hypothetical protein